MVQYGAVSDGPNNPDVSRQVICVAITLLERGAVHLCQHCHSDVIDYGAVIECSDHLFGGQILLRLHQL